MKKLKQSQYYGIGILVLMLVVFWAVFKVLAPTTFGSPDKLATYMKSALIYAVGGCGLYFICVMGPFDMSVGANIVLSSIIACNASVKFGYAGLVIAPLICGTIIGLINGIVYIKLHISSLIVTCALSLIYEAFSVYATNGKNVILSTDYRAFGDYPVNLILALSIGMVAVYARTVRATVLGLANAEFVEAARSCGARDWNIIFRHIIPNSLAPIIVRSTMGIGTAVLTTSSLSYLGLGVEPHIPEWGNILKIGSQYLETNPYLAIFPGLAIILLVLAFNFFGDGLRDALDPKLK